MATGGRLLVTMRKKALWNVAKYVFFTSLANQSVFATTAMLRSRMAAPNN
jgi:hypothetical protein